MMVDHAKLWTLVDDICNTYSGKDAGHAGHSGNGDGIREEKMMNIILLLLDGLELVGNDKKLGDLVMETLNRIKDADLCDRVRMKVLHDSARISHVLKNMHVEACKQTAFLRKDLLNLEYMYDNLSEKVEGMKKAYRNIVDKHHTIKKHSDTIHGKVHDVRENIARLKKENEALSDEMEKQRDLHRDLISALKKEKEECGRISKDLARANAELKQKNNMLKAENAKIAKKGNELDTTKQKVLAMDARMDQMNATHEQKNEELVKKTEEFDACLRDYRHEMESMEKKRQAMIRDVEAKREIVQEEERQICSDMLRYIKWIMPHIITRNERIMEMRQNKVPELLL